MISYLPKIENQVIGLQCKIKILEGNPPFELQLSGCNFIKEYLEITIVSDGVSSLLPPDGSVWKTYIIWIKPEDNEEDDDDLRYEGTIDNYLVYTLSEYDEITKITLSDQKAYEEEINQEYFGAWINIDINPCSDTHRKYSPGLIAKYPYTILSDSLKAVH